MTPCEKLGYKVGDVFIVEESYGGDIPYNDNLHVVLAIDDGTECPKFVVLGANLSSDKISKHDYIYLYNVVKVSATSDTTAQDVFTAIKTFLAKQPEHFHADVAITPTNYIVTLVGLEFSCETDERLLEVLSALSVLFKGD